MPLRMVFTAAEREKLGVLVNNISVFASQIVTNNGADFSTRALANLAKLKVEQEDFLKRLDQLAREQSEESPLRLIEDLPRNPTDLAQMLALVRRCLLTSAFLGHLVAQLTHPQAAAEALSQEKRLH
jgi:hypothetical protein